MPLAPPPFVRTSRAARRRHCGRRRTPASSGRGGAGSAPPYRRPAPRGGAGQHRLGGLQRVRVGQHRRANHSIGAMISSPSAAHQQPLRLELQLAQQFLAGVEEPTRRCRPWIHLAGRFGIRHATRAVAQVRCAATGQCRTGRSTGIDETAVFKRLAPLQRSPSDVCRPVSRGSAAGTEWDWFGVVF